MGWFTKDEEIKDEEEDKEESEEEEEEDSNEGNCSVVIYFSGDGNTEIEGLTKSKLASLRLNLEKALETGGYISLEDYGYNEYVNATNITNISWEEYND